MPDHESEEACKRRNASDAGRPCSLRSQYSPESPWFQGSRHIFGWIIPYLIESDSLRDVETLTLSFLFFRHLDCWLSLMQINLGQLYFARQEGTATDEPRLSFV